MAVLALDPAARPPATRVATMLRDAVAGTGDTRRTRAHVPDTVVGAALPPPVDPYAPGPPPSRPSGGRYVWVGVAALVLVAAVIAAVVIVGNRSGGHPAAAKSSPQDVRVTSAAGSTAPSAPTSGSAAPSAFGGAGGGSASVSTAATSDTSSYSAPGGLSVQGPSGWSCQAVTGAQVDDCVAPGGSRDTAAFFRIGIGNTNPAPTIRKEAHQAVKFLLGPHNTYTDVSIENETFAPYQGVEAVDIDSTGTNPAGNPRHNEQRLWIENGVTYEIELNTPADEASTDEPIFTQLVSQAFVN